MKKILKITTGLLIGIILSTNISFAAGTYYVNGYYRSNGKYVKGHYKTYPNNTKSDNLSCLKYRGKRCY